MYDAGLLSQKVNKNNAVQTHMLEYNVFINNYGHIADIQDGRGVELAEISRNINTANSRSADVESASSDGRYML